MIGSVPYKKPLIHNELLAIAFNAVRHCPFNSYEIFELSVSSSENPVQMVLRHKKSGRLKIVNIDRSDGSIRWDTDNILWN